MQILIIGSGSSAGKFIKILLESRHEVYVYRHRPDLSIPEGCHPADSLQSVRFDGAIVSSPSAFHLQYLKQLVHLGIPTLVEKPISNNLRGVTPVLRQAVRKNVFVMTGFNLRFLPIVQKIAQYCREEKLGDILHADLYVGQYLPEWRPWLDYRKNYSAIYEQGGGVSLDLIHEIDLALHFFPGITLKNHIAERLSNLEINTEDFAQFGSTTRPWVQVRLDYLNHVKTRQYRIVGSAASIAVDIFNKQFCFRSKEGVEEIVDDPAQFDIPTSFKTQTNYFLSAIRTGAPQPTERSLGIDALRIAVQGRKHVSE